METIHIPADAVQIISTSSKGDQSKWRVGDRWVKPRIRRTSRSTCFPRTEPLYTKGNGLCAVLSLRNHST